MSIISCRNITKDEEILVSYNYELLGAPQWYKDLWQSHKRYFFKFQLTFIKTFCSFLILDLDIIIIYCIFVHSFLENDQRTHEEAFSDMRKLLAK